MLDEGSAGNDPKYRLAQLQDALLRDVRFIVGIRMHTRGMTVEQAQAMFEKQGFQSQPVAISEAKRGTADADVRLLHARQADDPEAARRLQGKKSARPSACGTSTTRS